MATLDSLLAGPLLLTPKTGPGPTPYVWPSPAKDDSCIGMSSPFTASSGSTPSAAANYVANVRAGTVRGYRRTSSGGSYASSQDPAESLVDQEDAVNVGPMGHPRSHHLLRRAKSSMASFFVKSKRTRAPSGLGEEDDEFISLPEVNDRDKILAAAAERAAAQRPDQSRLRADKKRMISRSKSEHITRTPLRVSAATVPVYGITHAEGTSTTTFQSPYL